MLKRERLLLLTAVCEPADGLLALRDLSPQAWIKQRAWLDTSGLALVLFRILTEHGEEGVLPSGLRKRWHENRIDNTKRMAALEQEMVAVHRAFQRSSVHYSTLKGFSLHPVSVSRLEDRSQLDLDFLVAEESVPNARACLEERGYHLRAISGRSMEFKTNERGASSIEDHYKPLPYRCVELHVESANTPRPLLQRIQWRPWLSVDMPVLNSADLFLGQGMHLYKHIASEFFRAAHLVEFRRHVLARCEDDGFWRDVRRVADGDEQIAGGLGVALEMTTQVTHSLVPQELSSWTTEVLSAGVRNWIRSFGVSETLRSFPGSKLHLMLQRELEDAGVRSRRSISASLLPRRLPPPIAPSRGKQTLLSGLQSTWRQWCFILFRSRFHVVEGLRYLYKSWRWKQACSFIFVLLCLAGSLQAQQEANSPLLYSSSPDSSADAQQQRPSSASPSSGLSLSQGGNTSLDPSQAIAPGTTGLAGPDRPLTAQQIQSVLEQNPDAMVEVKQLVSDLATQSGKPISADSISDADLLTKINESAELRSNISVFLRTRGYVPDSDRSADEDSDVTQNSTSRSTSQRNVLRPFPSDTDRKEKKDSSAKEPAVLHRQAPYNLLALRDLYSQVQDTNGPLKRFGSDVFLQRETAGARAMTAPANPDGQAGATYVLGPGDSLTIQMWGGVSQSLTRVIDRDGQLNLPEVGALPIAGMTLQSAQQAVVQALRRQFRNVEASVTLSRLRSVRIYVVGDVQRPGAYELSALASPINALYAAGGPTAVGSLRILRHYRGPQLVGEIDLYDFLLHGVQSEERLQSGDTLLVPPSGPQVSVSGSVKRPAIYELKTKTSLQSLLDDAGAARVTAALGHVTVDRVEPNQHRETLPVNVPEGATPDQAKAALSVFYVQDGDKVRVSPIEPYSERVIYTEGHLLRPGRLPYRDGMRLSDVLKSYRDLLPEPADRGEIVRLVAPDLHVEVLAFGVDDLMIGNGDLTLQPFDTIRIYGRYEADAPKVTVGGEVLRPGTYSLSKGMTASQLVRLAGGFTRAALLTDADLTSYIVNGSKVEGERKSLAIGDAVAHEGSAADTLLKAGDTLNVHRLAGWSDIGASIQIDGEVSHPGRYGFQEGEHLSSVLLRAGGFRGSSYPAGAVLTRPEVKELEEKSKEELIRQIEISSSAARIAPSLAPGDAVAQAQLVQAQQQQVLSSLKSKPATGRLVLHISTDIASWANTPADIEVRSGDVLEVPKRPGFVLISGQVYNGSAITYTPGKSAEWYLRRAGGPTEVANRKEIFVIRANGSVVGHESGSFFHHDVLATDMEPGDVLVVPQKIIGGSLFWRNLLTVAQITSSIAITAAVAGAL